MVSEVMGFPPKKEELFSLPSFMESHIKPQMGISFGFNGDFMIDSLDFMLIESNFHGDFMEILWGFNGDSMGI